MDDLLSFDNVPENSLSRVWVDTRQTLLVCQELDSVVEKRRTQSNAMALHLVGPARCGKTSTMKHYLRTRGLSGTPLNYLWVELGATTTARNITNLTLHMLGDPSPSKGDAMSRRMRVEQAILRRRYDLIIFDEAHHLVDSKTESVQEDGVEFLNMLLNRTYCPIVLIGYDTMIRRAVHRNPSLAGRTWPCTDFRPYELANIDDMMEFRLILRAMENFMALPTPSRLAEADTAARIALVCRGRLGLLEMYLEYAWELCRRNGHSCLTREDLCRAADLVAVNNAEHPLANPFEAASLDEAIVRNTVSAPSKTPKSRR